MMMMPPQPFAAGAMPMNGGGMEGGMHGSGSSGGGGGAIYANATFNIDALLDLLNLSATDRLGYRGIVEEFVMHPNWNCDGHPNLWSGGNWLGHIFPAIIFITWASHWTLGFVRHYFECLAKNQPYHSKTTFRFLWFPERWPLEALVKFFLPMLNILLELWLAHADGFKYLICAKDTPRAGHMWGEHIGSWAHASMYPGFIVSGFVDLLALRIDLPSGTQQVFLSLGFMCEALLMSLHKKHNPMDIVVHAQLSYGMVACSLFAALEAGWPESPLLTAGRIASTYLQASWFIGLAHVMYEVHVPWNTESERNLAPVLYAPIMYIQIILGIIGGFLAVFVIGYAIYRPDRNQKPHLSLPLSYRAGGLVGGTTATTTAAASHHHHQQQPHPSLPESTGLLEVPLGGHSSYRHGGGGALGGRTRLNGGDDDDGELDHQLLG